MAFVLDTMVAEKSTTTGTSTYALGGTPDVAVGWRPFFTQIGNGSTTYYRAEMGAEWEEGLGTVGGSVGSPTLARTLVRRTHAGTTSTPLNWGAGTKTVACILPGGLAVLLNQENEWAAHQRLNGNRLYLDADLDSYLYASADDVLDLLVNGALTGRWTQGALSIRSSSTDGNLGPVIRLYRNRSNVADGKVGAALDFADNDDGLNETVYARVHVTIDDVTNATEDGTLTLSTLRAGSLAARLSIGDYNIAQNGAHFLAGKTSPSSSVAGAELRTSGEVIAAVDGGTCVWVNRLTNDGTLVSLRQAGTEEGAISVSGTTLTYATFLGSHWGQWRVGHEPEEPPAIGTVLCMCEERCFWEGEEPAPALPRVRLSAAQGETAVYGVYGGLDEGGDILVWALGTAPAVLVQGPVALGQPIWTSDTPGVAEAMPPESLHEWWKCLGRASISDAGEGVRAIPFVAMAG